MKAFPVPGPLPWAIISTSETLCCGPDGKALLFATQAEALLFMSEHPDLDSLEAEVQDLLDDLSDTEAYST